MCHLSMKLSDKFDQNPPCTFDKPILMKKLSQLRKFQHYTIYAKVGQLKVNNNQVMCHLSMKLSDMFNQNPPCTFDQIWEKPILMKNALTT